MFHPLISRACIWTSLTVLVALLLTIGLAYASAPAVHAQEVLPNPIRLLDDTTGGDCTLVGTWDAGSKMCTLTRDIDVGEVPASARHDVGIIDASQSRVY